MGRQAGRRLKQELSQEKSEKRRKKKQTLKQKKQHHKGEQPGMSPYARKKLLQKQGKYSNSSPFSVVEKTNEEIEKEAGLPLLTKVFNKGVNVNFVKNNRVGTFDLPETKQKHPCALGATVKDGNWVLSRYFLNRAHSKNTWTEEIIETPESVASAGPFEQKNACKQILSSWNYFASKFSSSEELAEELFDEYELVESYGKSRRIPELTQG